MASESNMISELHQSNWRGVFAFSGGGSELIGRLCREPGASRTILEATVPYARTALANYIGAVPEQYCAPKTARAMAVQAYRLALAYGDTNLHLFGFGCCASLSSRAKQGQRRIHLALQTGAETVGWSLVLEKNHANRAEEENLTAQLGLDMLAEGLGFDRPTQANLGKARLDCTRFRAPDAWQAVLMGSKKLIAHPDQKSETSARKLLFAGSFNPFHEGHLQMTKDAERRLGIELAYELCINNPDKTALDYQEIDARLGTILPNRRIWLTALPTFIEKCRHFPHTTFVVGTDTLMRILEPSYYHNEVPDIAALTAEISAADCDFLVYGRLQNGRFHSLADCCLPDSFRALCTEVGETTFRQDISSTSIRTGKHKP